MAPTNSSPTNGVVLNSWKEIATYLGRGIRTVQRYERDLGLPVRRPSGKSRSAVIALANELDDWLHRAPMAQAGEQAKSDPAPLLADVRQSIAAASELRNQCRELRTAHRQAMINFVGSIQSMTATHLEAKPVAESERVDEFFLRRHRQSA